MSVLTSALPEVAECQQGTWMLHSDNTSRKIISSESSTFCKPEGGVHHLSSDTTEKASSLNQKLNHIYLFQTFTTQQFSQVTTSIVDFFFQVALL